MSYNTKFEVNVEVYRERFSTRYTVSGPRENCEAWLNDLMNRYHPCGYGTNGKFEDDLKNGLSVLKAMHWNSCD